MIFFNSSRGVLCSILIVLFLLFSCSKDENPENMPSRVVLKTSNSTIAADGIDISNFTVQVFDENDELLTGYEAEIFLENQLLENPYFSTSEPGKYNFQARAGSVSSNMVRVIALSNQDLMVSSISLKANTQVIIANGVSTASFELEFRDSQGNLLNDVNYDLQANGNSLPGTQFKTSEEGQYDFVAGVNGIVSNTVSITSRPNVEYGDISIPVVFHIVHTGEAVGQGNNFSASSIERLLATLNKGFSNEFNSENPNAVDTFIQFRLATKGENEEVLVEPGIHRIDGRTYDIGTQSSLLSGLDKTQMISNERLGDEDILYYYGDTAGDRLFGRDEIDMLGLENNWNLKDYYNIYIIPFQVNLDISGYARYPLLSQPDIVEGLNYSPVVSEENYFNSQGALVNLNSEYINNENYTSIIHEIGHSLGLFHVFSKDYCETSDYCSDTYSYNEIAPFNTCDDNKGLEVQDNFMDYLYYRTTFTYEQRERMRSVLELAYIYKDLKKSNK